MAKLDKFEKEDVKRGINAHINKKQMFTPELKNKIRQQAIEKERRSAKLNNKKRVAIPLLGSFIGVLIAGILLFEMIGNPFAEKELVQQTIDESTLNTNNATVAESRNIDYDLFLHTINSTLKAAEALSTNDFQTLKNVLLSNTSFDEHNQTVTFHSGEIPFVVETKYFPPFKLRDLQIVGYDEGGGIEPILIIRIEEHSYEVTFSKDEGANGEYRISAFTGNR